MSDLVTDLRKEAGWLNRESLVELCGDAADEIEALRADRHILECKTHELAAAIVSRDNIIAQLTRAVGL